MAENDKTLENGYCILLKSTCQAAICWRWLVWKKLLPQQLREFFINFEALFDILLKIFRNDLEKFF